MSNPVAMAPSSSLPSTHNNVITLYSPCSDTSVAKNIHKARYFLWQSKVKAMAATKKEEHSVPLTWSPLPTVDQGPQRSPNE